MSSNRMNSQASGLLSANWLHQSDTIGEEDLFDTISRKTKTDK